MLFKEALTHISGLRYLVECLCLRSAAGRRVLLDMPFLSDVTLLEEQNERLRIVSRFLGEENYRNRIHELELERLKDIRATFFRLQEGYVLGDIELFEVKELALVLQQAKKVTEETGLKAVSMLPDVEEVVDLLDPEGSRIPQFYVYEAYSPELAEVRRRIKNTKEEELLYEWRERETEIEDKIRERLSEELQKNGLLLMQGLEQLALLDVLLAKAELTLRWGLCCPQWAETITVYKGLRHPEVESRLEEHQLYFQAIDIEIQPGVTIVTGANMGGKSVLLKSLLLAQYMAQFGFGVPALQARIVPVEEIRLCMGDEQDERKGLSSYAAEILNIGEIVRAILAKRKVLALIDEPARTTNPTEGRAIVNALADFLNKQGTMAVMTTHYSGLEVNCRRLRVKGFKEKEITEKLSAANINRYMDYALVEENGGDIPQEAIRIAEILGADPEWIDGARKYLNRDYAEK